MHAVCAVGSGLRSIVEKQLGNHSKWSRWPDESFTSCHIARSRRQLTRELARSNAAFKLVPFATKARSATGANLVAAGLRRLR